MERLQLFSQIANMAMTSTCSSQANFSLEVAHQVGTHRQRCLQKLEIASLETDPYLFPPDMFVALIELAALDVTHMDFLLNT